MSLWLSEELLSHFGAHQLAAPINLIVDGTMSALTMVASMNIANANPNPICLIITTLAMPNAPNTTTMIAAAPVMSIPVFCKPLATANVLSPVFSHS